MSWYLVYAYVCWKLYIQIQFPIFLNEVPTVLHKREIQTSYKGKPIFYGFFYNISEARFKHYFLIKCAMCIEYKIAIVTFGKPALHM